MAQREYLRLPILFATDPFEVALEMSGVPPAGGPGTAPGGGFGPAGGPGGGYGSTGGPGGGAGAGADAPAGGADTPAGGEGVDQGDDGGDADSSAAAIVVQQAQQVTPVFVTQPVDSTITEGANTFFYADATGFPTYQWQFSPDGIVPFADVVDGGIFAGATTPTLVLTAVDLSYNGYVFQCVATNGGGSATSDPASLTVNAIPPADDVCGLLIPWPYGGPSPYPDYATAAAAVAGFVYDCLVWSVDNVNAATVTIDTSTPNQISVNTPTFFGPGQGFAIGITIPDNTVLSYSFPVTSPVGSMLIELYDRDWNLVSSQTGLISPLAINVPVGGTYYVILWQGSLTPAPYNSLVLTCDQTTVFNPVVALWDDSGTTRQLEACPKMLLPPLTESTGDWYADATEAQDAIDDRTSNCVGYTDATVNPPDTFVFTATDGGDNLEFSFQWSFSAGSSPNLWGSVNAIAGQTLSFSYASGAYGLFTIFDYDGNVVEFLGDTTTPLISAPLPYTGRYTVRGSVNDGVPSPPPIFTILITSSGALSVNPIQALYDAGLNCPGRLDC